MLNIKYMVILTTWFVFINC